MLLTVACTDRQIKTLLCLLKNSTMKKCKMVSVFTWPDVNTREVGTTRR